MGILRAAPVLPPPANGRHRELSRVVVRPHGHPASVPGEVIDAIRRSLPDGQVPQVLHEHPLGLPRRLAFVAPGLTVPDQVGRYGPRRGSLCTN